MPEFYPIFLNLTGYRCLVAGFGRIGSRKLTGLLAAGCGRIDVFDSCQGDFPADRAQLLEDRRVVFYNRPCEAADVAKCLLVFAATGDKAENERIACLCRDMHVLCDSVSNPARNTFISPAVARKGALCAALSTGGQSPYLAGKWRKELEQWLEPRSELA